MFKVLNVAQVKAAEKIAIEQYCLCEDILIENAAASLMQETVKYADLSSHTAIFCGGGNNGADGLSLARKLFLSGYSVDVYLVSNKFNSFALARKIACEKLNINIFDLTDDKNQILDILFNKNKIGSKCDLIVDAMLGSGLDKPLAGVIDNVVNIINSLKNSGKHAPKILAVDIPTGLNSDTGEVMGAAVQSDITVTFCGVKLGHIIGEGRNYTGELIVADIGIIPQSDIYLSSGEDLKLPKRKIVSHKYNYGRVRIIGGSNEMIGASLLALESANAALKSGAGLATLCAPQSLMNALTRRVKESTLLFMPDEDGKIVYDEQILNVIMQKTGAIAIGMGMGGNDNIIKIIKYLFNNFDGVLIIDADGLNAISCGKITFKELIKNKRANMILTPHMGEFSRLTEKWDNENPGDKISQLSITAQVKKLAKELDSVIAAKSATTIISDGNGIYLNVTGTPAMSKGGSGDVLSGMIAAFACRVEPLKATLTACYHFGKCGERAEEKRGSESVLASDIIIEI